LRHVCQGYDSSNPCREKMKKTEMLKRNMRESQQGVYMGEEVFYDPIGNWLAREKGCVRDNYSQGYVKNIQTGGTRPDVVGIRYEVIEQESTNVIHFHGYVVEVKDDQTKPNGLSAAKLNELLGKAMRTKELAERQAEEWQSGLNTVTFYIAYPFEQVSQEVFAICEREGIGILRLERVDDDRIHVYEVPGVRPKQIRLQGISHGCQQTPGCFIPAIEKNPLLRRVFQVPSKLYYDLIKPKRERYDHKLKVDGELGKLKKKPAREALDLLIERITQRYPQTALRPGIRVVVNIRGREEILLSIRTAAEYFYIRLDDHEYRVYSPDRVLDFGGGFQGDLDALIRSVVVPQLESKISQVRSGHTT